MLYDDVVDGDDSDVGNNHDTDEDDYDDDNSDDDNVDDDDDNSASYEIGVDDESDVDCLDGYIAWSDFWWRLHFE